MFDLDRIEEAAKAEQGGEQKLAVAEADERCPMCGGNAANNWFDRSICSCGSMHTCCCECGYELDGCPDNPLAPISATTAEPSPVSASELLALVEVVKAARRLTEEPFGGLIDRDFYRLREALGAFGDEQSSPSGGGQ